MSKKLNHFKISITLKYAPHLSIAIEASSLVYPIFTRDNNLFSSSNTGFVTSCKINKLYANCYTYSARKTKLPF